MSMFIKSRQNIQTLKAQDTTRKMKTDLKLYRDGDGNQGRSQLFDFL